MTSDSPFRVGLLGHGTVGSAFRELLDARAGASEAEVGQRPEIAGVLTRSQGSFDEILDRSDLIVEKEPELTRWAIGCGLEPCTVATVLHAPSPGRGKIRWLVQQARFRPPRCRYPGASSAPAI